MRARRTPSPPDGGAPTSPSIATAPGTTSTATRCAAGRSGAMGSARDATSAGARTGATRARSTATISDMASAGSSFPTSVPSRAAWSPASRRTNSTSVAVRAAPSTTRPRTTSPTARALHATAATATATAAAVDVGRQRRGPHGRGTRRRGPRQRPWRVHPAPDRRHLAELDGPRRRRDLPHRRRVDPDRARRPVHPRYRPRALPVDHHRRRRVDALGRDRHGHRFRSGSRPVRAPGCGCSSGRRTER